MDWPPQGTDLDILEAGWDHLVREWNQRLRITRGELSCFPRSIPKDCLKKLQGSLSERLQAVLKNKGVQSTYLLLSLLELLKLCFCLYFHVFLHTFQYIPAPASHCLSKI